MNIDLLKQPKLTKLSELLIISNGQKKQNFEQKRNLVTDDVLIRLCMNINIQDFE